MLAIGKATFGCGQEGEGEGKAVVRLPEPELADPRSVDQDASPFDHNEIAGHRCVSAAKVLLSYLVHALDLATAERVHDC